MSEFVLSFDNIEGVPLKRTRCRETVALTRGIRAGREADFDRFYDRYMERLYAYLLVLSHYEEHSAREALQETFLRVLRYIKVIDTEAQLWAWLTRLARSSWIDHCRRQRRDRGLTSLDSATLGGAATIRSRSAQDGCAEHNSSLSGSNASSGSNTQSASIVSLRAALETLCSDDRLLVESFYFDGRSQLQLATELGTSTKAVESRLARIRRKLRTVLEQRYGLNKHNPLREGQ